MKILVTSTFLPEATQERLQQHMKAEVAMAWKLYTEGYIRDWNLRQDRGGAVLFLECASVEEAKKICGEFPLAKAGLMQLEYIPLGPFVPIATLFANQ